MITAAKQMHAEQAIDTLEEFLQNITLSSDQDGWDPEKGRRFHHDHARRQGARVPRSES
jgi:hypothetical protein